MKRQKQEATPTVIVTSRIPSENRTLIKKRADRMGMKFSSYVAWCLNRLADDERRNENKLHV